MSSPGLYIVGALGEVAATLVVGLKALTHGLTSATGLVTEREIFQKLNLISFDSLMVGGADTRSVSFENVVEEIASSRGAISWDLLSRLRSLNAFESGPSFDHIPEAIRGEERFQLIQALLTQFKQKTNNLCAVLNLASTEEQFTEVVEDEAAFKRLLKKDALPDSVLWARATIETGCGYINFTPSVGIDLSFLKNEAETKIAYAGNDGKTGETLLKTVLAPMFQERHLEVMSWESLNLLGNNDGRNLKDPERAQTKLDNKDQVVGSLLDNPVHTRTRIDYTPSLGDWKTAWNLIHFQGFLNTPMTLQFTWQGCDSSLAAPLCLDLVRLTLYSQSKEDFGFMNHTSSFFKDPLGGGSHHFFRQIQELHDWVKRQ